MCTPTQLNAAIWCGKIHPARVVDRIATKQQRTKYVGEGLCLGAFVTFRGRDGETKTGQVWAVNQGNPNKRSCFWYVADGTDYYSLCGYDLTVIGQAQEDAPLFEDVPA